MVLLASVSVWSLASATFGGSPAEAAEARSAVSSPPTVELAPHDPLASAGGGAGPASFERVDSVEQRRRESLRPGQTLWQGDVVRSANRQYRLAMQSDGNLVLYFKHRALWNSGSFGHARAHAVMQTDGNLVVYAPNHGPALWNSGTSGHPGAYLAVQTDGNLVIYSRGGTSVLWATYSFNNRLVAGERLKAGQWLYSPNRAVTARMQSDGNFVVYAGNRALWQSRTAGQRGAFVTMQDDGNLVVYSATRRALWNSGTPGQPGNQAALQSDGNLVVSSGSNVVHWNAGSFADRLLPGQGLGPGQYLVSPSGAVQLHMQAQDGNLVVYSAGRATWATYTSRPGAYLAMQSDGNLVVYAPGSLPLWKTDTAGHPGADVFVQDDSNLVVYASGQANPLWAIFGVGPPPGSTREDKAVSFMRSILGQSSTSLTPNGMWSGWCELSVEIAYGTRGQYGSAIADYQAQAAAGRIHRDADPPPGALVFYNLTSFGHVGVSIGGGQVISTHGAGDVALPVRQHGVTALDSYLGWSYAPSGWPGR